MRSKFSRELYTARTQTILERCLKQNLNGILLSNLNDIRWSCGFSGSNALLLISESQNLFITDGRYVSQAEAEVFGIDIKIAKTALSKELVAHSESILGFQSEDITVKFLAELQERLSDTVFVAVPNFIEPLRSTKTREEIGAISKALRITEEVLGNLASLVRFGVSEYELAAAIDYEQRKRGAARAAFETIVAFGENSALPHARPSERKLGLDDNILVDTGCVVTGYASDITRNYFLGTPSDEYLGVFNVVNEARRRAVDSARSGMTSGALDRVARSLIEDAGYGSLFSHGLGHGVGLDIHEFPRISHTDESVLPANAVITIEPGIYVPSRFGIRIEDLLVLHSDGAERLNRLSTDLIHLQ